LLIAEKKKEKKKRKKKKKMNNQRINQRFATQALVKTAFVHSLKASNPGLRRSKIQV
jgi:hypothetical protein